jgi:hypothetical protein
VAERLSAAIGWRLADVLRGEKAEPLRQDGMATFVRRDDDGTAWVRIPGNDFDTPVEGGMYADAQEGDAVPYSITGGQVAVTGNVTSPSVGQRVVDATIAPVRAAVSRATESIVMVRSIADAAKRVADAIDQHFWTDTSGIHVTNATQEDWTANQSGPNVLINSVGQLFRDGLNNLVAITTEQGARAISFFDGLGNEAENIMALFGADGARIGYADGSNVSVEDDGMTFHDAYGTRVGAIKTGAQSALVPITYTTTLSTVTLGQTYTYNLEHFPATDVPNPLATVDLQYRYGGVTRADRLQVYVPNAPVSTDYASAWVSWESGSTDAWSVSVQWIDNYVTVSNATITVSWKSLQPSSTYVFGAECYASGAYAFSEGNATVADGAHAHSAGDHTIASGDDQMVWGRYNEEDLYDEYAAIIGNGTDDEHRSNALTVDWSGNMNLAGRITQAVDSTTATVGAAASSIGTNSIRRAGNVVTVTLSNIQLASAIANNSYSGTIATIPSAYRPAANVYGVAFAAGANLGGSYARITTAGVVAIRNQSGSSIAASSSVLLGTTITYVIS